VSEARIVAGEHGLGLVLWTTDIPGMTDFLEKAAGVRVAARHPGFAELDADGGTISLHADEASRSHPWFNALAREGVARGIGTEIRLRVASTPQAFAKATAMGALSVLPPSEIDGHLECQVMGPDSYLFTFWQEEAAAPGEAAPRVTTTSADWPTRPMQYHRR
jgi:catechol 2,3-dioxygenase-like lactoylglutathione lyase family enzyme